MSECVPMQELLRGHRSMFICVCGSWGLTSVTCSMAQQQRKKKKKRGGGKGGGRRSSSLQAVLYIINYVLLCVQRSVQEGPALLCILTALCKWLAGGNDFREKVTLRPLVHINDSFIHFQVYKSRGGKEGVKVGWRRGVEEEHSQSLSSPKITCGQHLPIKGPLHSSLDRRTMLRSLHVGLAHGKPFHSFTLIIHTWQGGVVKRGDGVFSHFICKRLSMCDRVTALMWICAVRYAVRFAIYSVSHPDEISVFRTTHLFRLYSFACFIHLSPLQKIIGWLCDRYHKCQVKQTRAASHDVVSKPAPPSPQLPQPQKSNQINKSHLFR